jgi:hypothetical protein
LPVEKKEEKVDEKEVSWKGGSITTLRGFPSVFGNNFILKPPAHY